MFVLCSVKLLLAATRRRYWRSFSDKHFCLFVDSRITFCDNFSREILHSLQVLLERLLGSNGVNVFTHDVEGSRFEDLYFY